MPEKLQMLSHLILKWLDVVGEIINTYFVQVQRLSQTHIINISYKHWSFWFQNLSFPHVTERFA